MATDYTTLDAAILQAIAERGDKGAIFGAIQDAQCMRDDNGRMRNYRDIDRRLQALNHAGRIVFRRGAARGWYLVEQARQGG